jgi:SAM-dependent MidA family methyltransferase
VHPEQRAEFPAGCVFANEVVDALPVHRVRREEGELHERYVTLAEGEYREVSDSPSTPELARYFDRIGLHPPEGAVAEVCLQAEAWLADAASRLSSGYLVTIDYGGPASEIIGKATPRGGLKCFYQHGWTEDPFDRPGLQDITAPVDFTNLLRLGESLGLETALETTQRELLGFLGLSSAYRQVEAMDLPVMERQRNLRALEMLADAQGLGGFRVLLQQKQAPRFALAAEDVEALLWTPLLPAEAVMWPQA